VRSDLPIPQQAVQACHAAYAAGSKTSPESTKDLFLILCEAKNEQKLLFESERLNRAGIAHVLFREPDLDNQITALATLPLDRQRHGGFFRGWSLWRGHSQGAASGGTPVKRS